MKMRKWFFLLFLTAKRKDLFFFFLCPHITNPPFSISMECALGGWRLGAKFFHDEFTLNYIMATYRKPQVILNYPMSNISCT